LLAPARTLTHERFCVAGPQYPPSIEWPENAERLEHVPPDEHPRFYCAQDYTLSVTRAEMSRTGWAPSVRLFEAGACGAAVITDPWPGVEMLFRPGYDILVAHDAGDVVRILRETTADKRRAIGERLRERVLAYHTAERRAEELEAIAA
jgi:spore maturation protein CgeB